MDTSQFWAILAFMATLGSLFYSALRNLRADINSRLNSIESRMQRFENDMIEIKTILRMKECCMIKDERIIKKAE